MATNTYFNHLSNQHEQSLLDDLVVETIKMHGMDVGYIQRHTVEQDALFGEDIKTTFENVVTIEAYLKTVDGFEGDGDVLAKFGIMITDSATFTISKRRFNQLFPTVKRPTEGDLIFLPLNNGIFEITSVTHDNPFYQFGKRYTFDINVELFTNSYEDFITGNANIDKAQADNTEELARADNDVIQQISDSIKSIDVDNPFGDV